ncbi:MAG: hypothetical protein JSV91_05740 [Phycisphaerales bacterium]|nr:MAG: hypothetical protein JSV91_05740 [Phycisphaerales bacterium]
MTDKAVRNNEVRYELVAESGAETPSEPPLRLLRRALRGRYGLVVILSAALAAGGGIVGFHAAPPSYESTGLVQVEGAIAPILYESQENRVPPLFDSFIASQVTLLQNRRVLEAAVSSPQLQEAGWPSELAGVARLEDALTVRRGRGEQMISVSVTDRDPRRAQAAVDAVLNVFERDCYQPGGLSVAAKTEALVQRQQNLEQELRQLRERILETSDQYGIQAIERMHASKVEELMAIDAKLAELQLARTNLELGDADNATAWGGPSANRGGGSKIARLGEQELELKAEIASLQTKYGPNSPMIRELNRQLEAVRIQRDLYRGALADLTTAGNYDLTDQSAVADASRKRLDELEARYVAVRDEIRAEAAALGAQRVILTGLDEQVTETKNRLLVTRHRLDELRLEARDDTVNRIKIAAYGDLPIVPISDRQNGLATAGAMFGAIMGAAIVFFIGITDPRIRYAEALEALNLPVPTISLMPDLDDAGEKADQLASRGVHQLRNLLELQCRDSNRNVHAVTSCDRGEGKTSLTLALGASFAAAGRKTLVIDADITRCSLTRELNLADVPGLCETIGPDSGSAQVHLTRRENLWALPIGSARGLDPEDLSHHKLIWLIDALRNRFDAIVLDTGPILTSVEAALVTAVSDRTIMVVRRDQKAELIRSSVARLSRVGAHCLGIVFNRATAADLKHRESSIPVRTARAAPLVPAAATPAAEPLHPLARAVDERAETAPPRKRAA